MANVKQAIVFSVVCALMLLGAACSKPAKKSNQLPPTSNTQATNVHSSAVDPNQPDLLIKHLGINLGEYDPGTNMAGDIKFIKTKLGATDRPMSEFGYVIPASTSSTRNDKPNPQPTFSVPLGTKVHSLVDGEVVNVEKLYSNDYTIMVASSASSAWIYETEHVINPLVKVGDRVKAGEIIAEVSSHDSQHYPGIGLVEIGILHGRTDGRPPEHFCPFQYFDPAVKEILTQQILSLQAAWEAYRGNQEIYGDDPVVACKTLDPIEG